MQSAGLETRAPVVFKYEEITKCSYIKWATFLAGVTVDMQCLHT